METLILRQVNRDAVAAQSESFELPRRILKLQALRFSLSTSTSEMIANGEVDRFGAGHLGLL